MSTFCHTPTLDYVNILRHKTSINFNHQSHFYSMFYQNYTGPTYFEAFTLVGITH